jgi:hypothetical protein
MAIHPVTAFPGRTSELVPVRPLPRIRLDLAQRASVTNGAVSGSYSQVYLYNNAQQGYLLVVRAYSVGPAAALPVNLGYLNERIGNVAGVKIQPVLPDRGLLAGQLTYDNGSLLSGDYVDYQGSSARALSADYPIAVIPPGWSLFFVTQVVSQTLAVSVLWETLTPDQFTEQYGSYT